MRKIALPISITLLSIALLFVGIALVAPGWFHAMKDSEQKSQAAIFDDGYDFGSSKVEGSQEPSAQIEGVSTSSEKFAQTIPPGKPGEMTVSCVIDTNCGGGEKILPLSVCEKSACCFENGQYIQHWDKKVCGNETKDKIQNTGDAFQQPQVLEQKLPWDGYANKEAFCKDIADRVMNEPLPEIDQSNLPPELRFTPNLDAMWKDAYQSCMNQIRDY